MTDTEITELRPANENPWYCLATLHGEQPSGLGQGASEKNRSAWNQRFADAALSQRTDGPFHPPITPVTAVCHHLACAANLSKKSIAISVAMTTAMMIAPTTAGVRISCRDSPRANRWMPSGNQVCDSNLRERLMSAFARITDA
jgi:hypothetical protein